MSRIFLGLGVLSLLGGVFFFVKLVIGGADLPELIVFPIFIAYSLFGAVVCFVLALISYLLRRKKSTKIIK